MRFSKLFFAIVVLLGLVTLTSVFAKDRSEDFVDNSISPEQSGASIKEQLTPEKFDEEQKKYKKIKKQMQSESSDSSDDDESWSSLTKEEKKTLKEGWKLWKKTKSYFEKVAKLVEKKGMEILDELKVNESEASGDEKINLFPENMIIL